MSVIIPVYNGEKYLERCLESVLNQSYYNIHLLILNDASTDNSDNIIKKYLTLDDRIQYIRNESRLGPAQTRNKGLAHVSSTYIMFLDCDDWIDLNCIEKAMEKFQTDTEIDIVLWEIKTAFETTKISSRYKYQYNNTISNYMALNLLSHTCENEFFLSPLLGCKIFKKTLLDFQEISFPDTIYEDDMFTFLAFLNSRKIGLITGSCLYYYQHPSSLTHHFTERNIFDFFNTFHILYGHVTNENKEHFYKYLSKSMQAMINNMIVNVADFELQAKYKSMIFTQFNNTFDISEYYTFVHHLII